MIIQQLHDHRVVLVNQVLVPLLIGLMIFILCSELVLLLILFCTAAKLSMWLLLCILHQIKGLIADLDIVCFVDAAICIIHIGLQSLVRENVIRSGVWIDDG
jgi:hypothetical protein